MELRHLKSFCVMAEEMHVTRAAARLHIAQPALTQQIRALEKEVGYALVRRDGRGIELTEAGQAFREEARAILDRAEGALRRAREAGRGSSGQIRVGMTELAACSPVVSGACAAFRREWPGVAVAFAQEDSPELARALTDGRIDVAFGCPMLHDHPEVEGLTLSTDGAMIAAPRGHALARRSGVPLEALEDVPLVLVTHGRSARSFAEALHAACRDRGFAPNVVQECPELLLALGLVAAGGGVSFVPDYMKTFRRDAIAYASLRTSAPLRGHVVLATRPGDPSPIVGNFKAVAELHSQGG